MKTKSEDHKGIIYASVKDMCDAYDVSPTLYLKRIERGWSVQEALEGRQPYFSRDGVDYYSQKEVCKAFGIHPNSFRLKQKNGYSIDEIVDRVSYRAEDHLGNRYRNEEVMCAEYGVKVSTYRARIRKGMSKEEALTS
ncbi:hypothetical protein [Butyrivibrio sp. AC2005]|uniref:hypothetical protein n=1 Tax=Butyrivibrio sp. AC2005 TaxID=1280672 RepID=UPI000406D8AA|nr:hypothetical protein [Butyrivibrio sp. AC2005]